MSTYPPVDWIVPNGGDRPSFSRDGSKIVYEIGDSLYTVGSHGGKATTLLAGTDDFVPSRADWSWSPDTIAFAGAQTGGGDMVAIWLIDCDGSNLRRLPDIGAVRHATYPSWYEDLQWIVAENFDNGRFRSLWRFAAGVSPDPVPPVQLTTADNFCAGRPSVAPGGENAPVAFAGTRGPYNENFNQIWIVYPPALEPVQLNPQQGRSPNWSPDGKWILYESNRLTNGNYQLFVAAAPGPGAPAMEPVPLTDPSMGVQHGEWSRQQDRIVFERGNGEALGVIEVPSRFRS